jgi:hypothetical protein
MGALTIHVCIDHTANMIKPARKLRRRKNVVVTTHAR